MKKLQNNFTTPEQSKRLLELGVPAESADTTITGHVHYDHSTHTNRHYWAHTMINFKGTPNPEAYLPCWSVGRLIEILIICGNYFAPKEFKIEPSSLKPSLIENIVDKIEELEGYDMLDFSKLD